MIKSFFDNLVFTCTNIIPQIFLQTGQPRSQGSLLPVGERTWERSCKQARENIKFNHEKYPIPGRHSLTNTPTVGTRDKCLTNTREGYGYSWNWLSRSFQCFFHSVAFSSTQSRENKALLSWRTLIILLLRCETIFFKKSFSLIYDKFNNKHSPVFNNCCYALW